MKRPVVGVIMAGGSGERFWPISRQLRPKQLLKLSGSCQTLLQEAVNRLLTAAPPENIYIATNTQLKASIRDSVESVPPENVIAEPLRRNTCGCLALATAHILARWGDQAKDYLMALVAADHRIGDRELFARTMKEALQVASEQDALVVLGIEPTRPETGYGYIEVSEDARPVRQCDGIRTYQASRFKEKPSREDAEHYLETKRFYWNSGMFFWKVSTLLHVLERFMPEMAQAVHIMADALRDSKQADEGVIQDIFEKMPNISIDYGIMERANPIYMVTGQFPWDDIGSWDSMPRLFDSDEQGNVAMGDPVLIDCQNSMVYNEPGASNMAVGVVGLKDTAVVVTADGILICPKDRLQDVRKVVDELKRRGARQV